MQVQVLGRVHSMFLPHWYLHIAAVKHKVYFTPHSDYRRLNWKNKLTVINTSHHSLLNLFEKILLCLYNC